MSEQQQQPTFSRFTPAALAGAVMTGIAAFILSMFGFSDRLSSLSGRVDTLTSEVRSKDESIRRLSDQIWELRREVLALRKPMKPAEGDK